MHGSSADETAAGLCMFGSFSKQAHALLQGGCSLLQTLVARCTAHQNMRMKIRSCYAEGHNLTCPLDLHQHTPMRHAAAMQGSLAKDVQCPAGRVSSLPAADADGALPQRQEGAGQEAVEDQAFPAVLRRPNLLTLQLPADVQ